MRVFMDFEASSLGKASYPIEVAWVFEDGRFESHLIVPAADWTDWATEAEAIHNISREMLRVSGTPHGDVARRMIDELTGHDLLASAPSWDGKWMSVMLRAAGLPRHALRLRDSDDDCRDTAEAILRPILLGTKLDRAITEIITEAEMRPPGVDPVHRALADAQEERAHWLAVRAAALRVAEEASRVAQ